MALASCRRSVTGVLTSACRSVDVTRSLSRNLFFPSRIVERPLTTTSRMADTIADPTQRKLMQEQCLLVDENDEIVGHASKLDCHRRVNIEANGMLHRAFSVFLFNSKGELLLQERADSKVTFPGYVTNTCCSHPLYVEDEMINEPLALGVKRAAQRRVNYELGVPLDQLPLESFNFLARVHYRAMSGGDWGEHEMDYVLFMQKDVDLAPNDNEVRKVEYVSLDDFPNYLEKCKASGVPVTPWFDLIGKNLLTTWWKRLDSIGSIANSEEIHRYV
ncbi:isopentenyl-diphosphate Delta-isomerase 1-like [Sycon ciliatum]|uniref:isopentenyl-diphosphate Delta-isomerase 1-like n=1 Tax=Sycon ciliatum TaxID=27933 RepID=UPI0031F6D20D|eukprot:scpid81244/ scgid29318/ Isopentenyl-diphosphate Delta-isomerase I; Isopentenyl pyrophosphate isomerase I